MTNKFDKLSKKNIFILTIGIIIFALSFLFIAMIGSSPEGIMGFISPVVMLIGIITIVAGFLTH